MTLCSLAVVLFSGAVTAIPTRMKRKLEAMRIFFMIKEV